jgi:benzodiazapine receptor
MSRDTLRQAAVVFAALVTIVINILANALPLNGKNTGAISDSFHVFFVPAGYVFAIWGVIYLAIIAFTVYQALPAQRANPRLRSTGWLFVLGCVANSAWIFLWHYGYLALTIVAMLTLLASLMAAYVRLDIGRSRVRAAEWWCVDLLFSIYLGWITVATVANITDLLYQWNWSGWGIGPEAWAAIMLLVALAVTLAMILTRLDVAYCLVIIWASAGIAAKQAATPLVANTAWLVAIVVILALAATWLLRRSGRFSLVGAPK